MLLETALLVLHVLFVLLICYAIVTDASQLRINNWVSLGLIGLFVLYAPLVLDLARVGSHLLAAGAVFLGGVIFFVLRWIGGGDVKLASALMLWLGPVHGIEFLLLAALMGGVMAVVLLMVRNSPALKIWLPDNSFSRRVQRLAEKGVCPYGIPIGIAALISSREIFILA